MRPYLSLLALLPLLACVEQEPVDSLADQRPADVKPVPETIPELTGPETTPPSDLGETFRWEPLFRVADLGAPLNGTGVSETTVDGWVSRSAGSAGAGRRAVGSGPRLMRSPARREAPTAEVAMDYDMAPAPAMEGVAGRPDVRKVQGSPLRAGTTDDNVDFEEYLGFLESWKGKPGVAGNAEEIDVRDRRFVEVVDEAGRPVPGAKVSIVDRRSDLLVWSGTTYGDGHAPFYPHLAGYEGAAGDWLVQASVNGKTEAVSWKGKQDARVVLSDVESEGRVKLDVVFLIDTTGSMSDEIARIKSTLLSVTGQVNGLGTEVDLQYGAVLYRDIGDEYLTRHTPLTRDIQGFDQILQGIQADGGGDGPESLNQGLSVAVSKMDWRSGAAKMVFLVADAPPHMDYQDDATYGRAALTAMTQGIRIHTVAASGLDDFGSLVFRQSAQLARGKFIFIEYGSTAASAADHGVTGTVASNNLDAILFQQIRDEVEGWGRGES